MTGPSVEPAALVAAATTADDAVAALRTGLARLRDEADEVFGVHWHGTAARAIDLARQDWEAAAASSVEALERLGALLRVTASDYRHRDADSRTVLIAATRSPMTPDRSAAPPPGAGSQAAASRGIGSPAGGPRDLGSPVGAHRLRLEPRRSA